MYHFDGDEIVRALSSSMVTHSSRDVTSCRYVLASLFKLGHQKKYPATDKIINLINFT